MSDTLSVAALSQEPSELYALSIAERRALQETTDQEATVERVPGTPAPTLPGESPPGPTRRSRRASHPPEVDEEVMAENRLGPEKRIDYWRDVAFRRLQAEQGVRFGPAVPTPVQGAGPLTILPDTPCYPGRDTRPKPQSKPRGWL